MQLVSSKNVLYGSDFPWTPTKLADTAACVSGFGFSASELSDIECGNALRLFPRLKKG